MALSIKHPEADQLARRLESLTGLSLTDAVVKALSEQLDRETGRAGPAGASEALRATSDRCVRLADLDTRSPEEIVDFDEYRLPR